LFSQVSATVRSRWSITTFNEGRYLDINESFLFLLGYTREEVVGRTSLELGIWEKREHRTQFVKMLKSDGS